MNCILAVPDLYSHKTNITINKFKPGIMYILIKLISNTTIVAKLL